MSVTVTRQDPRYKALMKGHNLRFPANPAEGVDRIVLCESADDAAVSLQAIVASGLRPTVRSGGHCYEDFVANNPGGAILDLSLLNTVGADSRTGEYLIASGASLGEVYTELYKRYALTLPAGSCGTVGAGGHISGGGYGLLSRLFGLSCDWVTAIDVLTVDANGKVVARRVDRANDPGLFRALRGAGGGSFGIVTAFRFASLPKAPLEVAEAMLEFPFDSMSEEQFVALMTAYGDYWETRGRDPDTWGLFAVFEVGARSRDRPLGLYVQFCQPDGTAKDLSVLHEFFDRFRAFNPNITSPSHHAPAKTQKSAAGTKNPPAPYAVNVRPWFEATIAIGGGGGGGSRGKYKSAYMKRTFTPAESKTIYRFFSGSSMAAQSSVISIDSYGGAINRPQLASETSIAQRGSVMKLQWQCYWRDPAEDAEHLRELDEFFTSIYTGEHVEAHHQGTPWGDRYEGCYMNYPDADMLRYPFWPQLFYGQGELYPFLQQVKNTYDPNNIFHSAMSIRAK
jgi:FAD/FMN-containing dehydrogenase